MAGPYSTTFPERIAIRLVHDGLLEVREDGTIWRIRRQDGRAVPFPRRVDYGGKRTAHRVLRQKIGGELYSIQAHRLVWQHHHGDIPAGLVVNHKDGNPANNRVENLELVTQQENLKHRFRVLGHTPTVTMIRDRYAAVVEAAREAVASGQLDGLRAALEAFDEGEARWRKKAS